MAVRTNVDDVKDIINTALGDDTINAFIVTSSIVVDGIDANTDCNLSDERLEEIEKYLTAHIIQLTQERLTTSERVGEAQESYSLAPLGKGLEGTGYGQMALMLDTCGLLIGEANAKRRVTIYAVTSKPANQWTATVS